MAARSSTVLSRIPDSREWSKFFEDAGLPSVVSAEYALIFESNRIKSDYLNELNDSYLKIMGIEKVGDIIAILRHSKSILGQLACETVSEEKTVLLKTRDKGIVKNKSCGRTVSSARVSRHSDSDEEDVEQTSRPVREEVDASKSESAMKRKLSNKAESNSELIKMVPTSITSSVSTVPTFTTKKVRRVVPPLESESYATTVPRLNSASSYSGKAAGNPAKKTCVLARLGEKRESSVPSSSLSSVATQEEATQPSFIITDNFGLVKQQKSTKTDQTVFARLGNKSIFQPPDSGVEVRMDDSDLVSNVMYENEDADVYERERDEEEDSQDNQFIVEQRIGRINQKGRVTLKKKVAGPLSKTKPALPYMGILKSSKQEAPVTKNKKLTTMRADDEQNPFGLHLKKPVKKSIIRKQPVKSSSPISQSTEGIFANSSRVLNNNVKQRLGGTNIVPNVNNNPGIFTKKVVRSKPTQVRSIGSTTASAPRTERKRIVFDLMDDGDNNNDREIRKRTFINSSRVTPAATSATAVKRVTFSEHVTHNYSSKKKLFFASINDSSNEYVPPPITLRTCVFDRLG